MASPPPDLSRCTAQGPVLSEGTGVRFRDNLEVHHLMCPVCGALPGTTCIEDDQEQQRVHPSRRLSIAERNYRSAEGWLPPELKAKTTR
jgi:hypothetical protein